MWNKTSVLAPYWLLEAVRLKESQWGPIEDAAEVRRVLSSEGSLEQRLLARAQLLGQRQGWVQKQQAMQRLMGWSLLGIGLIFALLGVGAALGALATTDGRVNVLWALLTLLALPTFSLLLWLGALLLNRRVDKSSGVGVAQIWVWLSRRFIKGPDQLVLFNAFFSFLSKQRLWHWLLSLINHSAWLVGLSTMLATLLLQLAARRYTFNWETTLLSADSFVQLVHALGWLPGLLGFSTPSSDMIRLSDGLQVVPSAVQVQWSSWLMGCVLVYGFLPRLIALLVSLWRFNKGCAQVAVDPNQVGLLELRQRLVPVSEYVGIDAVAGEDQVPVAQTQIQLPHLGAKTLVVGVELSDDQRWPPVLLPSTWEEAGLVDSREQRVELLQRLSAQHYEHLVLCVDAEHTPDRGVIAWLAELATYSAFVSICLLNAEKAPERLQAWLLRLEKAGFEVIYTDINMLLGELKNSYEY